MEAMIKEDVYQINGYDFEVLVVPYAKRLPDCLLQTIKRLKSKVIFIDAFPEDEEVEGALVLSLQELPRELNDYSEILIDHMEEKLVFIIINMMMVIYICLIMKVFILILIVR